MVRKIFLFCLTLLIVVLSSSARLYAAETSSPMILQPRPIANQTLFGEDQYFTVTFRGNGEAVVTMKAIITNTSDAPLSSITLHMSPDITPKNISSWQVIAKPQCAQYSSDQIKQPTCLQYQQPDYRYIYNDAAFQKISPEENDTAIVLTLPTPIAVNETGSYLLSFSTFAYTRKTLFGAYDFAFQTPKVDDAINTLQVGITTDSDLYIKGAKGLVNYDSSSMKSFAVPQAAGNTMQNQQFNDLYNQIGQGMIVKNASHLEPLESYTTKGSYADAVMKLYGEEISITIVAILIVLAIIFFMVVGFLKRRPKQDTGTMRLFFLASGVSFTSVFLASLYTGMILCISQIIDSTSYGYGNSTAIIFLLIAALSVAVYFFFLCIPAVIIGVKKGLIWGGVTFFLTIVWAGIATSIFVGVIYIVFLNRPNPYPVVTPLLKNATAPVSSGMKAL